MEEIKAHCSTTVTDSLIKCEENRSKIIFENTARKEIKKIIVDGCQITDNTPKCDNLLIDTTTDIEYFVELKGHDIPHALRQIEATMTRLSKSLKKQDKFCFIISVRCPLSGADIQQKQKEYRAKYNATLIIKNSPHKHPII
ncbi:hypothetical protein DCPSUM001_00220 [Dysgonomonas capnocytophagoides]|uniref:hypothetical protein n=1 Tax=Dysgonomonas capnocytophagoides TaxID=45254 RepID=UPI00292416F2|nr:hypothetical protein DCPSUM001_00220 [Dysgonomonas capnocytophagoides]